MDTAKASISIGDTSIQLEGSQEFVEKYLEQYRPLIQKLHEAPKPPAKTAESVKIEKKEEARAKRTRIKRPPAGLSCADRIRALIDENYFAQARTSTEVMTYLKEQKGTPYADNIITANLSNLFKAGKLRRFMEGGKFQYVNP